MQSSRLYVGNLKYSVTDEQLKHLFSYYGDVRQVKLMEGKGFGFIEMSSIKEAESAKQSLNNTIFRGRAMKVEEARPLRKREYAEIQNARSIAS